MSSQVPSGFYEDSSGNVRRDRRRNKDRRNSPAIYDSADRRDRLRRHDDHEIEDRERSRMIEDALEEFAAEHQR